MPQKNIYIKDSYLYLRRAIGILGMLLPFICIFGGQWFAALKVQDSISDYYYTNMRDFFVGLLVCVSLFLVTYKGYSTLDTVFTSCIGILGLGIPFFPCTNADPQLLVGIFQLPSATSGIIHLCCAMTFFLMLALNSLIFFTKSSSLKPSQTPQKRKRNFIYRLSGWMMIIVLGFIILSTLFLHDLVVKYHLILWAEAVMLFFFGLAWLVKGETLFRDKRG